MVPLRRLTAAPHQLPTQPPRLLYGTTQIGKQPEEQLRYDVTMPYIGLALHEGVLQRIRNRPEQQSMARSSSRLPGAARRRPVTASVVRIPGGRPRESASLLSGALERATSCHISRACAAAATGSPGSAPPLARPPAHALATIRFVSLRSLPRRRAAHARIPHSSAAAACLGAPAAHPAAVGA